MELIKLGLLILLSLSPHVNYLGNYGSKTADGISLKLEIKSRDAYQLYAVHSVTIDVERETLISEGKLRIRTDTLILKDSKSGVSLDVRLIGLEKLQVISPGEFCRMKLNKIIFYCFLGYYDNGDTRFSGGWCGEKKCG